MTDSSNEILNCDTRSELVRHLESYATENSIQFRDLLKDIAKRKAISLRALEKITSAQVVRPSVETQIKIYSYIYNTNSVAELITKLPSNIASSIQNVYSGKDLQSNPEIESLTKDSVFNSIYLLSSGEIGTELNTIREEFGKKGLLILDKMLKLELVYIDENELIKRKKAILMTKDFRKNLISFIANDLYRADESLSLGTNYSGCLLGDVTVEDYSKIYSEVKDCINNVKAIILNSKPTATNQKKIALGAIMDEIVTISESEEGYLC